MLSAVIFDMDGVLINSEPAWEKVELGLAERLNIPMTEELQKRYTGVHHSVMWKDLKNKFDYDGSAERIIDLESRLMKTYYEDGDLIPIKPTIELIKKLRESCIDCAIATSNDGYNADLVVKRLELTNYISIVVSSSDVEKCKPAPDIFLAAAEKLNRKACECVVVEDSASGCTAANAAGMKVVGYNNPDSGNQDLSCADIIVQDMGEVNINMLKGLNGSSVSKQQQP